MGVSALLRNPQTKGLAVLWTWEPRRRRGGTAESGKMLSTESEWGKVSKIFPSLRKRKSQQRHLKNYTQSLRLRMEAPGLRMQIHIRGWLVRGP